MTDWTVVEGWHGPPSPWDVEVKAGRVKAEPDPKHPVACLTTGNLVPLYVTVEYALRMASRGWFGQTEADVARVRAKLLSGAMIQTTTTYQIVGKYLAAVQKAAGYKGEADAT